VGARSVVSPIAWSGRGGRCATYDGGSSVIRCRDSTGSRCSLLPPCRTFPIQGRATANRRTWAGAADTARSGGRGACSTQRKGRRSTLIRCSRHSRSCSGSPKSRPGRRYERSASPDARRELDGPRVRPPATCQGTASPMHRRSDPRASQCGFALHTRSDGERQSRVTDEGAS
jgi:hypothetical protein